MFCRAVVVSLCLVLPQVALSEVAVPAARLHAGREAAARKFRASVGRGRPHGASRTHAALRREDRLRAAASGHQLRSSVALPRHVLQDRCAAPNPSGVIHPADFGADPSGREDATEALQNALSSLLDGPGDGHLSSNIKDLSGRTLDLAGGEYLLSAPLVIPAFFGNFRVVGGTLRASKTFPADRWIVELGDPSCSPDYANSCNEFVVFEDLILDGGLHAAGCLRVINAMGVTVGPAVFVEGFTQVGLRIDGGHETLVQEAWFAERFWSEIPAGYSSESIAIQVNGNDHMIVDTIIWQYAHLGVELNGAANVLMGVHAWGCGQPWCSDLTGISVNAHQNRLIGCYLDYNTLDIVDPNAVVVEDSFFLGTNVKLIARSGVMNGFVFKHNTGAGMVLDGSFSSAIDVTVEENVGGAAKATSVRSYQCGPSRNFSFDLSSALLLPQIDHFHYSLSWTAPAGVAASSCEDSFKSVEGQQCHGLQQHAAPSEASCREACCASAACDTYMWSTAAEGCWIGVATHCEASADWSGGRQPSRSPDLCSGSPPASGLLPQPRVILEHATATLAFDYEFAGAVFVEARCCGAVRAAAVSPTLARSVVL